MSARSTLALILEPGSPKPDAEIGKVVASRLALFPADAVARVRYGGGIIINGAPAEVVEEIAESLREIGVRTRALGAEILESAPRGLRATQLELYDEAISARSPSSREVVVLDGDVRGVNVHALPGKPAVADDDRGRLQIPVFSAVKEGQLTSRGSKILQWIEESGKPPPSFVLTLYVREPVGPIRFERETLDYSILGDGKMPHSIDNFLSLAEKLLERFPDLRNRDRVAAFLADADPDSILLFKAEEAQNFDRWMQTWIRLEDPSECPDSECPDIEQESR